MGMSEVKHPMPKGLEEKIHQYAQKYVINKDGFGCTVDYKECCRAIWETEEIQGMLEALKFYGDKDNWDENPMTGLNPWERARFDRGRKAKEAIEFMEKK